MASSDVGLPCRRAVSVQKVRGMDSEKMRHGRSGQGNRVGGRGGGSGAQGTGGGTSTSSAGGGRGRRAALRMDGGLGQLTELEKARAAAE